MKQKLIDVLEKFCPDNVFLQGTIDDKQEYPETFITFWTNFTDDNSHYDNNVHSVDWQFSVFYYSTNPELVNSIPDQISKALRQAGFIPQGKGNDIPSDRLSHTGWVIDFIYTEIL